MTLYTSDVSLPAPHYWRTVLGRVAEPFKRVWSYLGGFTKFARHRVTIVIISVLLAFVACHYINRATAPKPAPVVMKKAPTKMVPAKKAKKPAAKRVNTTDKLSCSDVLHAVANYPKAVLDKMAKTATPEQREQAKKCL